MSLDRGLIIGGEIIPGSEWILREPSGWDWARLADRPDLRLRRGTPVELTGGHWTAGPCRTGLEAARRVVASMRARKRPDGSLADVSVHHVIGWDGLVFQVADPLYAAVHMAKVINLRSVSTEITWPGSAALARRIARQLARLKSPVAAPVEPVDVRMVRGHRIECLRPPEAVLASWVRLCELYASLAVTHPHLGIRIPRVLADPKSPRRGALEHFMAPGTTKLDAGGYLLEALEAAGWARP